MRLILTTMILTMLVQPVWAQYIDADSLHSYCETWQRSGYSGNFEISHDGLKSATCASYMAAMADLGRQSCDFVDPEADYTSWDVEKEHLAATFIIQMEREQELRTYTPYTVLLTFAAQMFPCD